MLNKQCSTVEKRNNSTCNTFLPEHYNSHSSSNRNDKKMSCLSPIQECSSEYNHHASQTLPSHRRSVSAFSSLAELKIQQKLLQRNKPIQFTVGGNVRSECVMTAVPESHFCQKNRGPNEKDLELLGFALPNMHESTLRHAKDKCSFELRDEDSRNCFTCDQRTEVSVGVPYYDEFHEEEDKEDDDDELQLSNELSKQDNMHTDAKTRYDKFQRRGISFKKPWQKIAKKVWRRVKPMLCKTRTVFKKKKVPELQRSKGFLT